jgi:lactate dehydrogenase-like 2-hydroxyacid dehydrogenase
LDVLPIEPSDDSQSLIHAWEKSELWIRDRLVVTPHVAFYSPESFEEMRLKAVEEALRVVEGDHARNCVN